MKNMTFLRQLSIIRSRISIRSLSLLTLAIMILGFGFSAAAQDTTNLQGQKCPTWVHDLHTTTGPDGKVYATWHPPVDPTYGCWFDHEHGSDPRQYVGFSWAGMPPFTYTGMQVGIAEPHEGFKVYVSNDDLNGRAFMFIIHQGSRGGKRAFTQFHSVDMFMSDRSGNKLVQIYTMADFGYGSPNCSGVGNETPAQFEAIPNSGSGYPFDGHQPQRRFVPTVGCAATRAYETWTPIVNVNNVFKFMATFDIDNPSTVADPNDPNVTHFMCEYRNQNEDCASFYGTRWSGNKRNIIAPQYDVTNRGSAEFYTDAYGKAVAQGTPGAIKQYVTNNGWSQRPCYCNNDVFRPQNTWLYKGNADPLGPTALLGGFPFGPNAPKQPPGGNPGNPTPAPTTPAPTTPAPTTPAPTTPAPTTPAPTAPSLVVNVNPATANVGETVNVTIGVANVTNLYGLQTQCVVDANVLTGVSRSDGDIFNTSNSFFVDTNFQSDGKWMVAAARLQPNAPFSGNGAAYTLSYSVNSAGSSSVTCSALAVDSNGNELTLEIINGSFNGGIVVTTPPPTEVTPSPEPTEPVVTVEPTGDPATPPSSTTVSGVVSYQNRTDNAGIIVSLLTPDTTVVASVTTGADGTFKFENVLPGTYGVTAVAPQHLLIGKLVEVTTTGVIEIGTLTLPAGDTDNSGVIDLVDAGLVGGNFNLVVPPAPTTADLNGDSVVDIRDLVLVGSNFGLSAPVIQ